MTYQIDEEHHCVIIYGTPDNIRLWLDCLDKEVTHGIIPREFKDQMDNLEQIMDFDIDTTVSTMYDRIYFQKNKILYRPNASGEENDFLWPPLKQKFERARKRYEKMSKK